MSFSDKPSEPYNAKYYAYADVGWNQALRKRGYIFRKHLALLTAAHLGIHDLIEIGCGLGFFTYTAASMPNAPRIRAGDISNYAVASAQRHLAHLPHVKICKIDAQALPFEDASADAVVAFDVAEHLPEPNRLLAEAWRVLRPNGIFMMTVPNPNSFGARVKKGPAATEAEARDPLRWFGWRDTTHVSILGMDEWRCRLRKQGFDLVRDGSDFLWDTPYFAGIPVILQKLFFNGSHHILMRTLGLASYSLGENYVGLWRKR